MSTSNSKKELKEDKVNMVSNPDNPASKAKENEAKENLYPDLFNSWQHDGTWVTQDRIAAVLFPSLKSQHPDEILPTSPATPSSSPAAKKETED